MNQNDQPWTIAFALPTKPEDRDLAISVPLGGNRSPVTVWVPHSLAGGRDAVSGWLLSVLAAVNHTPPEPQPDDGVALIAAERNRQVTVEGWTPEHDDHHANEDLRDAAACYLVRVTDAAEAAKHPPHEWPWDPSWWKPSDDPVRNLVRAGALIAAEIDRIRRVPAAPEPELVPLHELIGRTIPGESWPIDRWEADGRNTNEDGDPVEGIAVTAYSAGSGGICAYAQVFANVAGRVAVLPLTEDGEG